MINGLNILKVKIYELNYYFFTLTKMDGEEFYRYIQNLIIDGILVDVEPEMYRNSHTNIIYDIPWLRDYIKPTEVKITLTDFRRLQNLIHEFDGNSNIHDFVNGFIIGYNSIRRTGSDKLLKRIYSVYQVREYKAFVLVPGNEEMALETVKYIMPIIVESRKPKHVIRIVIRYIKDFKYLIPDVVRYYKETYMDLEDL